MSRIGNDHQLRVALEAMSIEQQRVVGGLFAQSVLGLCDDPKVQRAVSVAVAADADPRDLDEAFRNAKAVSVKTYTDCGKDTDWLAQAAHFVAAAAAAAQAPRDTRRRDKPPREAPEQARMARNCEMIERGDGGEHDESQSQYAIAAQHAA